MPGGVPEGDQHRHDRADESRLLVATVTAREEKMLGRNGLTVDAVILIGRERSPEDRLVCHEVVTQRNIRNTAGRSVSLRSHQIDESLCEHSALFGRISAGLREPKPYDPCETTVRFRGKRLPQSFGSVTPL